MFAAIVLVVLAPGAARAQQADLCHMAHAIETFADARGSLDSRIESGSVTGGAARVSFRVQRGAEYVVAVAVDGFITGSVVRPAAVVGDFGPMPSASGSRAVMHFRARASGEISVELTSTAARWVAALWRLDRSVRADRHVAFESSITEARGASATTLPACVTRRTARGRDD